MLDLGLVGADIDNEDKRVVLLNLLHGAVGYLCQRAKSHQLLTCLTPQDDIPLGVERVKNDRILVKTRHMGNRLALVLGPTRELEGLGTVEGGRLALLVLLQAVGLDMGRVCQ